MSDSLPDYRHILQTFITQSDGKQLISHQIESFNQFIEVDIPEIIHMSNPVTSYGSPEIPLAGPRSALATATGLSTTAANALMGTVAASGASVVDGLGRKIQHEYEVTLEFEKISIRKPTIFENNGAIHPMMPNDARLRNLTYAAPLNVDVKVTTTFIDHTRNSIRESNVRLFPNVHLGKIPVMVGSKYCLLHDQKHMHPSKMGECAEDVGGYFIIQGGERAMISMERMSENRPFVFRNGRVAAKQMEIVEIKCIGPDNDQVPKSNTVKIVYHPKNQLLTMLRATVPRIKTDIPVVILFRALGVLEDKDIYELILGAAETSQEEVYDPIMTETILEASGIRTRDEALAWLGEHTNTWSVKSQKQGNVQDILSDELFPQIGGHEMNYEKACFLAHMCRKVLWTTTKRIPTDDRDAYPNKRVDIPGFLLADLFRKTYNNRMVKDMKAALSKEIHGGSWKATGNWTEIVNINNINKIIKATIMDVCLKSSLATGNFGCGKIGGPNKVGVSQVLNRMNFSAGISHLRRISTPIEKTGKLIAPRKQHNSQICYVCVRGDTAILQGDGMTSRAIMDMKDGDTVLTANDTTLQETPSPIHHYFKTTPSRVLEFKTLSGRTIGTSPDHPLLVMREGASEWIHACEVNVGDAVVVKNYTIPLSSTDGTASLRLTRELIQPYDSSENAELQPFMEPSEEHKQILARLLGASCTITKDIDGYRATFYVDEEDAADIRADIERLGFTPGTKEGERGVATLLVAVGGLVDKKEELVDKKEELVDKKEELLTPMIPSWIRNGSSSVKREFLSAFQGRRSKGQTQLSTSGYREYLCQMVQLFKEVGVDVYVRDSVMETLPCIGIQASIQNIARYVSVIGYRYCAEKRRASALYIEYILYRNALLDTAVDTGCQEEGCFETIQRICNGACSNCLTLDEFRNQTRQVDDKIIMPITSIRNAEIEDVYDFTTESENHDFYANGILVRNCPCETPEGHGVGVVKNMSMTTMITIFSSPATVYAFLQRMNKLISLRESTIQQKHDCTRVFLNGAWIGVLLDEEAQDVVDRLRKAKRAGVLHLYTGIIWKNAFKELWLTTEAGRVIRPIYYAPALREVAADKTGTLRDQILAIHEWNNLLRWQTPSGKNLFEYIDAGETDNAYFAMDYAKAISDPTTTHCEIHASVILGTTASYIPFPDHNQSPRNAYQCLWENEEVLMATGVRKAIKDVKVGEKVMSFDPITGRMTSVGVIHQYVRDTEKSIYRLTTVSGRTIVATDNHPFITEEGWKSVEDIRGSPVKKLGIVPNWVGTQSSDEIRARLYGFYHRNQQFDTKDDAEEFDRDVLSSDSFALLMMIEDSVVIPEWILSGSDPVKREFLAGFQSCSIVRHHSSKETLLTYLTHIQELYAHFGVECEVVQNESYSEVGLTLSSAPSNIIRCYDTIGYRYSTSRIVEGFKNVECLKSTGLVREEMTSRDRIVFVPLESIVEHQNVRIADITVDNENHSFITSHNIGSHNSSMGKQAMGIYALNFRERFDAMSHVLCYPEVPMVSTYMSRYFGAQKLPAGQNIVVAIMTYTGYNQEDSNMINRAALDRGRFRSIFYRTYKDEERKNQSSGEEEKFCRPDPTETKHMKNAHYDKIGEDGFIPRNTYVTPDDILIGKVVPLRVPTGAVLPAGAKKSRDVSKMPRNNEKGYVDKIYKNRNGEGYSFVKIRMRQDRIPEIGDKFSSRHGSFEPYSAG